MNILIPAAGAGSRFKNFYTEPKPFIPVDDEYMIVLAARTLNVEGKYFYLLPEHELVPQVSQDLEKTTPMCMISTIDYVTAGAVQSALLFENEINNDDELIITNCDQVMHNNLDNALNILREYDAGLITIYSDDPKHSYAAVEDNNVINVVEKEVISHNALTGIHYWKRGSDFVSSAKRLIADNKRSLNEFYISTTYNYLIADGLSVGQFMITENDISFIGTPEDLNKYNAS